MAMSMEQPPILSRVNRLDNVVRHLEEMRGSSWRRSDGGGGGSSTTGSPSTNSDGCSSSSPRSLQENNKSSCRPMDAVVSETEHKGTLLHRLSLLEDRVLELEREMEHHHDDNNDDNTIQDQSGNNIRVAQL